MDTRDSPEQAELRRAAQRLAATLGPATVAGLDDAARVERLGAAVRDAGWLELRDDAGAGAPLAGGVEVGILADALGGAVCDVAFAGPILAADLARRAGLPDAGGRVVAFAPDLLAPAVVHGDALPIPLYAVDGDRARLDHAFVLLADGEDFRVAELQVPVASRRASGSDLTRGVYVVDASTAVPLDGRPLRSDDLAAWNTLGLALTSSDLVGVMRGVLDVSVEYTAERKQYGVPVGSFQAVQHLLADARCLLEGSISVALHAAWAVDNLPAAEALAAGRVAKAYCTRAARTVCETAIQVHGGIGNTWECIVHVYLRHALLSAQWFGDDGVQLGALQESRLGIAS